MNCPLCATPLPTPDAPCSVCQRFFEHLDDVLETADGRKAVREKLVEYDKRLTPKKPAIRSDSPDRVVGEEFLARLGEEFRKARRAKRLTQPEVAGKIGVTHYQLSRWEHGTQLPNLPMFIAWARVLETRFSELLMRLGE